MACRHGHLDIVTTLLGAGANVNQAADEGLTILWTACANGHAAIVPLLVAAGADMDQLFWGRMFL